MEVTENSRFSWKQFWVSMVYENLPPVILSPIAALLFERSIKKAWHVCQHRGLLVVSPQYNSPSFIAFSWLLVYPGSWLITAGIICVVFFDLESIAGIDSLQMIIAYAFLFCRRLIIAVKYGYFSRDDFAALSDPAPDWNFDKTRRKLIAVGWSNPKDFPGLLEEEFEDASRLSNRSPSVSSGNTEDNEDFKTFVMGVLDDVYSMKKPTWYNALVGISVLGILLAVLLTKQLFGTAYLGSDLVPIVVNLATYAGVMTGIGIMGFGLMCAFDFERRSRIFSLLKAALSQKKESSFDTSGISNGTFDVNNPTELDDWMSARSVLRSFGERFYLRVQTYTSILLCFSLICVALLNLIAWTQMEHNINTIVLLSMTILVIAFIGSYAMYRATQLQQLSYATRASLQKYLLEMEVSSGYTETELNGQERKAKDVLRQIDENINFMEIIYRPISLLGYRADSGLIGSILGLMITGCLLAIQGFVESDLTYSTTGWSLY